MAFKIEKALTTLFGTFKLQSQGNLPVSVLENVQPTIDLNTHALAAAGLTAQSFGTGPSALGVMGSIIQAEDWYVVGVLCGYSATVGAGEYAMLQVDVIPDGQGGQPFCVTDTTRVALITGSYSQAIGETMFSRFKHTIDGPIWTRRGTRWQLACTNVTVPAPTGFASLLYYPIKS